MVTNVSRSNIKMLRKIEKIGYIVLPDILHIYPIQKGSAETLVLKKTELLMNIAKSYVCEV